MTELYDWFIIQHPAIQALYAGLFTWGLTALGASLVFLFKNSNRKVLDFALGFTGGVMIAASFWSLLSPAIEYGEQSNERQKQIVVNNYLIDQENTTINKEDSEERGIKLITMRSHQIDEYIEKHDLKHSSFPPWIPPGIGFLLGILFLYWLDKMISKLRYFSENNNQNQEEVNWKKTILLVIAIAIHNIPEGLAVGVAFGALQQSTLAGFEGSEIFTIGGAIALAIGIGIQNFPEGFAVSMPLRRQGVSRWKSWQWGQLSAIVEPIFAVIGALIVMQILPILPYALAFAAGAMIFIVVEEVIPESQRGGNITISTMGLTAGFIIMMTLDVALG